MRPLNALVAGLAGAAMAPVIGLADYELVAGGALRPPSDLAAVGVVLVVLAVGGFFTGVLTAALWNVAIHGR